MKQYDFLRIKKLFDSSDLILGFAYRAAASGDNYALFGKTDCFDAAHHGME